MLSSPDDATLWGTLQTVEEHTLAAAVRLLREGQRVPPGVIGIGSETAARALHGTPSREGAAFICFEILDLQQRMALLKTAVVEASLHGFVFIYDGFVEDEGGRRTEAILAIAVTARQRSARAVLYWRRPDGLQIADPIIAPSEIAQAYQDLFRGEVSTSP